MGIFTGGDDDAPAAPIDLVAAMRKVDATHDPAEANGLLTEAAAHIDACEQVIRGIGQMLGPDAFRRADGHIGDVPVLANMAKVVRARIDEVNAMRECLLVLSEAQVGGGSFRTAAFEIRDGKVTPDTLRTRFNMR